MGKRDYSIASNPAKVTLDMASHLGTTTFAHRSIARLEANKRSVTITARGSGMKTSASKPQMVRKRLLLAILCS
ncbi:MAG: hypothetical protein JO159_17170 [Acidobacteria bacterium]|nr:hypothetical protein [Acidobacteriota bacterium]